MKYSLSMLLLSLSLVVVAPSAALATVPTIFNVSLTALAGDVVFLQGDNFGTTTKVRYSPNSSTWTTLTPLSSGTYKGLSGVSVRIPSTAATNLYTFEVYNGSSWSTPCFVNLAHAMSFDTPDIMSGSSFRIFGRNLKFSNTPVVNFYDQANPTVPISATVNTTASTAYFLAVTAPSGIVAGHTYNVQVSNGYSGSGTYSTGVTVADETLNGLASASDVWNLGEPWGSNFAPFYNNVIDASLPPYNADKTGATDAEPAIQSALSAANAAGGGVVYLPAGNYALLNDPNGSSGLIMWSNEVLEGAGSGQTTISYGYGAPPVAGSASYAVSFGNIFDTVTNIGITNLTLHNVDTQGNWWSDLIAGTNYNAGGGGLYSKNLFVSNVVFNANNSGGSALNFGGIDRVAVENCNIQMLGTAGVCAIIQGGGGVSHTLFKNNTIAWSTGAALSPVGGDVIYEANNFVRDCSYPQTINTRVIDGQPCHNTVFLNNTFSVNGTPSYTQNDGETISAESANLAPTWNDTGTVTSATTTTLTDTSKNWATGASGYFVPPRGVQSFIQPVVAIISGTGAGQWSYITGNTSTTTMTVSPAFKVVPNSTSKYTIISWCISNELIYGNNLSNNPVGIQMFFIPTINCAIVNNTLVNNGGIDLITLCSPNPTFYNPMWTNQIVGNSVTDTNGTSPADILLEGGMVDIPSVPGPQMVNNEVRSNFVKGIGTSGQIDGYTEGYNILFQPNYDNGGSYTDDGTPMMFGTVLQNNIADNCESTGEFQLDTGDYMNDIADSVLTQNSPVFLKDNQPWWATHASTNTYTNTLTNYEWETATLAGGANIQNDPYASNGAEIGEFNYLNASATLKNVNGGTGGVHTLTFTYAWSGSTNSDLYINGVLWGAVNFPDQGGYGGNGHYGAVSIKATLKSGATNTIMFRTDSNNGAINLDKMNVN